MLASIVLVFLSHSLFGTDFFRNVGHWEVSLYLHANKSLQPRPVELIYISANGSGNAMENPAIWLVEFVFLIKKN